MVYFDLSQAKAFELTAMVKDVIKWHWRPPASKISNSRLSK